MNQNRKSQFVTLLSLFSIVVAFYFVFENVSAFSMQNNPEMQLAKQFLPSVFVSPAALYFEILLNIIIIIASIGLFLRLNWARIGYMIVLSLTTVWEIYSSINAYYALDSFLEGYNLGNSLMLIVFWSLLGVGINIYLIRKLTSSDVKLEFARVKEIVSR